MEKIIKRVITIEGFKLKPKILPVPAIPKIIRRSWIKTEGFFNHRKIKTKIKIKGRGSGNQVSRKSNPPKKTVKIKRILKIVPFPFSNFTNREIKRINKVANRKFKINWEKEI